MSVYLYEEDKIQIKLYYYFLRADGKVSDAEREWLERFAHENDIDMDDVNKLIRECENELKDIDEDDIISKMAIIARLLSKNISGINSYIGKVIWNLVDYGGCDGEFSDEESVIIGFLTDFLGIKGDKFDKLCELHSKAQALEESKDALKKDRSKSYDEITVALQETDKKIAVCQNIVSGIIEKISETQVNIDDGFEFSSYYSSETEKKDKLKLFYSFIMADGDGADSEIEKIESIASAMEIHPHDIEAFLIKYGRYYDDFLRDEDYWWRSMILCARALVLFEEHSGIINDEVQSARIIWTLVSLAYADEDYSTDEEIILTFCKAFLDIDDVLFSEMTDTAETMLMLEKKKDWFKQSGLSYDEVSAQLNIINSQIESLASDIEFSVSEADIA
ncbi:MAG: hypothetical protein J6L61_07540 [Ruminiclostridium sp.]|nr:hypothetical protein [Ruminiclostridium sp.]